MIRVTIFLCLCFCAALLPASAGAQGHHHAPRLPSLNEHKKGDGHTTTTTYTFGNDTYTTHTTVTSKGVVHKTYIHRHKDTFANMSSTRTTKDSYDNRGNSSHTVATRSSFHIPKIKKSRKHH